MYIPEQVLLCPFGNLSNSILLFEVKSCKNMCIIKLLKDDTNFFTQKIALICTPIKSTQEYYMFSHIFVKTKYQVCKSLPFQ